MNTTRMPATWPERAAELASARERLFGAIERAIALLDDLDGDPDLEPDACHELSLQPVSIRGGARAAA